MIRALLATAATTASAIVATVVVSSIPDACQLLTVQEAAKLAGYPVSQSHDAHFPTLGSCVYNRVGEKVDIFKDPIPSGVEIHYSVFSDAAAAHGKFPHWGSAAGAPATTVIPVPNLGDEAFITHGPSNAEISGVQFRHNAVLLSIGVHPPVSDAALKAAAATMLSRL